MKHSTEVLAQVAQKRSHATQKLTRRLLEYIHNIVVKHLFQLQSLAIV